MQYYNILLWKVLTFNFLVSIAGIECRVTGEKRAKKVSIGSNKVNLEDLYITYLATEKVVNNNNTEMYKLEY